MHDVANRLKHNLPIRPHDLADASGFPRSSIYKAIADGRIESVRLAGSITIPAHAARRLLGWPEPISEDAA